MTPQQTLEALISQGFTYYRIAKDTGLNARTLSNWHKGKTKTEPNKFMVKVLEDYAKDKSISRFNK